MKIRITGATLLSAEEFLQVPEEIRRVKWAPEEIKEITWFNYWWWLRSPGRCDPLVAFVSDSEGIISSIFACAKGGVRPALQLNLEAFDTLIDGTRLRVGEHEFTVVCGGAYALCDTVIGVSIFREQWDSEDANKYDGSDIQKVVDDFYHSGIEGRDATVVYLPQR